MSKRKNDKTYFETPWLKYETCDLGCCDEWADGIIAVCQSGLRRWDISGAKKIKICVSTKPVRGAIKAKPSAMWLPDPIDICNEIWWWVEVWA